MIGTRPAFTLFLAVIHERTKDKVSVLRQPNKLGPGLVKCSALSTEHCRHSERSWLCATPLEMLAQVRRPILRRNASAFKRAGRPVRVVEFPKRRNV